jgi:hypothetical protein
MDNTDWSQTALNYLRQSGTVGEQTADFLQKQRTRIGFAKHSPSTGARWTVTGSIEFNLVHYSTQTAPNNPHMLSLLVHEARHLQQGWLTALSVYGELDAWQTGYEYYKTLTGQYPNPVIAELCALPLGFDRSTLQTARQLMQTYAGKGYRADLLPLYPLPREIGYWLALQK